MTMDHFPSLRHLTIFDDVIGEKAFLDIFYPFFKFVNPTFTSKLVDLKLDLTWIIPIGSNSSYEDEALLPRNGWRQLDALLTSSQYPSLRYVYILIWFSASWDLRLDPGRYTRFRDIHNRLPSLFPLLSCSDSIGFDFELDTAEHEGF
jgi:hypothetical protein